MCDLLANPFLWATIAMFGMVGGDAIQGSPVVGRRVWFGVLVIGMVTFARIALVLPFVQQPRFESRANGAVGLMLVASALALAAPLLRIRPATRPDRSEPLRTTGVYGLVRHPGYLANVIWGLGWAILFGSTIGVLLTPVWLVAFFLHALIEEEVLERELGAAYTAYKARVRSRLIPGLPF